MLEVIITKEELYDKCENVEQLYDGFYYPLLVEYKELKKQLEVLEQENKKYKEVIDKAIEFTNKNCGTWCTHHFEYMTELQDILKEAEQMSAKEMFEELGLFRNDMNDGTIRYADDMCYTTIWIKGINDIHINWLRMGKINQKNFIKLFKAINKQIEDLGWNK